MAVVATPTTARVEHDLGRRAPGIVRPAVIAVAVGLVVVVARDGTPGWQAARALAVVGVATVAWRGLGRQRSTALRIVTALGLSSIAVPVGVGFGGPHAVKTGLTLESVAGVLVLLGGVALFGAAATWTARSTRRLVGWPALTGAVLLLGVMSFTLGQAVAATNVPRPSLGTRTPADLGLTYRDVQFEATDGVGLSGWYIPTQNGAAAVLLHGAGSTRSDVLDHAAVLARNGYGVLLFDARGHGRSGGRAMDFGWFGDRDIGGAVGFLTRQADVDAERIAAVGMSMGGEQAIGAAASIDAIRAVVAEGATNRVAGDKAWLSEAFGVRGAITEAVEALTYGFADLLTSARPPVTLHDAVRTGTPTLLVAGEDAGDEPRVGAFIRSASPSTVELWVAPDTPHTDALRVHPDEWEARVVGFLDHALDLDGGGS